MTERFNDSQAAREALSALADGQAQASDVSRACAAWRDDAQSRATWQAYHLIGDVMRSEDLAQGTGGAAFLSKFRERMAHEPVVLAPPSHAASQPAAASVPMSAPVVLKRRAWAGPMAVAAGFVMVVGAVVSMQMGGVSGSGGGDARQMAQAPAVTVPARVQAGGNADNSPIALASTNAAVLAGLPVQAGGNVSVEGASFNRPDAAAPVLIRDPQVDQLLASLPRHANGVNGSDGSFASQGGLARAAVFELP